RLRLPPENDKIIRTLLAQSKDELLVSFLLRRVPTRVHASVEKGRGMLLELFWDSADAARPAIAFRVSGLPAPKADGVMLSRSSRSAYAGRWEDFFREYASPLRLNVPFFYSLPE